MYVFETTKREDFLANAAGVHIQVVRMPTVQAVRRGGVLRMLPAVELTYSFIRGDQQWVYREVRLATDDRGRIDLGDTLWADLEKRGGDQLELLHRSGSF